ncbi:MAG: flagellar assembly protein FliW [Phycisphaerae bacterium]
MRIDTVRFGPLEVDEERLIEFADGLLGFPEHHRFALIQTAPDPVFFWLQSAEDPALAFVVCDPLGFVPDYQIPVRQDDVDQLAMRDLGDCQVLVIVNRVDEWLTGNLLGPLVIGVQSRRGKQMVLSDKRYSTRQKLVQRTPVAAMSKTA